MSEKLEGATKYHTFRVNLAAIPERHGGETEIYLDDKRLLGAKSITIHADVEGMTTVEITMYANVVGAAMVAETEGATA